MHNAPSKKVAKNAYQMLYLHLKFVERYLLIKTAKFTVCWKCECSVKLNALTSIVSTKWTVGPVYIHRIVGLNRCRLGVPEIALVLPPYSASLLPNGV